MNSPRIFFLFFAACLTSASLAEEKSTQRIMQYSALEARKVAIRPEARVDLATVKAADAASVRKAAWGRFDLREWADAADLFLTALEKDPESVEAAEGLAMSVYHTGDYDSAYRLGEELSRIMPSVKEVISETVLADVRYMVSKEEFDAANEFLKHFPPSDDSFMVAHQLVNNASAITKALGPDGDMTTEPAGGQKPKRFAKN